MTQVRRLSLSIFLLTAVPAIGSAQVAPFTRLPVVDRAGAVAAGRTTDDRIVYYSKLASEQPRDARVQVLLGLEYLQKMRETGDAKYLNLASRIVDAVLTQDQENAEAARVQNEINMQLHRFRSVAEKARYLTNVNPSDTGAWGNLGDALMELGDYTEAADAYKKMLTLRPNLASYNRAAYFHFVTGAAPVAITLMKNAIESGGRVAEPVAWCWSELGDMYFKTGSLKEARVAYENALKLHSSLHRAHAGLGRLYWNEGKLVEATDSFKRAQAVLPLPEYLAALEDLSTEQGRNKEAQNYRQLLDAVGAMAKANGEKANRVLAIVYADHNRKLDEAMALAESEFENRGDVYSYDAFSWVLYRSKRLSEAEEASAKALKFGTPEPTFYFHAGMIAFAAGKKENARKLLARALELNGSFDPKQARAARQTLEKLSAGSGQ